MNRVLENICDALQKIITFDKHSFTIDYLLLLTYKKDIGPNVNLQSPIVLRQACNVYNKGTLL